MGSGEDLEWAEIGCQCRTDAQNLLYILALGAGCGLDRGLVLVEEK